jgi:predicted lipoprotein
MTVTLKLDGNDYTELVVAIAYATLAADTARDDRMKARTQKIFNAVIRPAEMNLTQSNSTLQESKVAYLVTTKKEQ